LKHPETLRWREKFLRSTWTHIKEKVAFKDSLPKMPLNEEI
jgi:hypothetical protein